MVAAAMSDENPLVCEVCGVQVARSTRLKRWLHLGPIPPTIDPDHVITPTVPAAYEVTRAMRNTLRLAAQDMLDHHATLHPLSDCAWARRLQEALKNSA